MHVYLNGFISLRVFIDNYGRSQYPRSLRQVLTSAARTLGSQVRILLGAWMCVCVFLCCVVLCQ
jgi:hypothetical protein